MNIELVVVQPFGLHVAGEVIFDSAEIARVLASNPHAVVKRAAPPAPPAPAPAPTPAPVKGN